MYKSPRTIKGRMCANQKAGWFSDRRVKWGSRNKVESVVKGVEQ